MLHKDSSSVSTNWPRIAFGPCAETTQKFVEVRNESIGLIMKREEVGLTVNEHLRLQRLETQLAKLVQISWPGYTGKAVN